MLQQALKEWAAVCLALARGEVCVLPRKGGIDEAAGEFRIEHPRFWLFPTFMHQHADALRPDLRPLLEEARALQPPEGVVHISHFAEVVAGHRLDAGAVQRLAPLFPLTDAAIAQRFAYRQPGLVALLVRVWKARKVLELPDSAYYQGCRSWVELESPLSTKEATPVLTDAAFAEIQERWTASVS